MARAHLEQSLTVPWPRLKNCLLQFTALYGCPIYFIPVTPMEIISKLKMTPLEWTLYVTSLSNEIAWLRC